jgi:hypothetical protein
MSRRIRASDLHFDVRRFSGRKVLFLGRDIKDTLVSAYHQATKRNVVFSGGLSAFLRDEQFGTPKIVAFYRMWLTHRQVPTEFLYLAYEEMHREPVAALRKALAFIGETEINEEALQHAVARGSFDNMRKIETGQTAKSSILKPADPNDQNSFKTRKGVVGGHAQELSPEDIAYIDGLSESLQGTAFVRE